MSTTPTPDTLDSLSNTELDQLFAAKVAGLEVKAAPKKDCLYWARPRGSLVWHGGTPYCEDADAVLPHLDAQGFWNAARTANTGEPARVRVTCGFRDEFDGYAPTFARAAVIALLRAAATAKGGESS